jgi:AraC-like DNA-binding protein
MALIKGSICNNIIRKKILIFLIIAANITIYFIFSAFFTIFATQKSDIEMQHNIYSDSLLAAWSILFTFGICLIFSSVPKAAAYKNYLRARIILGVALILFGIQILLQWEFDFRDNARHIATSLNLTCFYLQAILFGMSFISLLDAHYITRKRMVSDFGKWAVCMVMLWIGALALKGTPRMLIMIATSVCFFCDAMRITLIFFRTYHRAVKSMDDYYSDNVKEFVAWIYKSTYGIVFFGLTGAVLAFAPKAVITVQMIAGIGMFIYIFLSFMNYMINYETVEVATTAEEESEAEKTDVDEQTLEKDKQLKDNILRWTTHAGFVESGLTVDSLASILGTNRTYLSNYINRQYTNFYDWIAQLRLNEAKRLLIEEPQLSLSEVAIQSGFSSQPHMTHRFKLAEKMPPGKWRKEHANI